DAQAAGEQFVTTEDSMGIINASRGRLDPASVFLLSEPAIVCRLARAVAAAEPVSNPSAPAATPAGRTGPSGAAPAVIPWQKFEGTCDAIRDRIARVVPGFEDYNRRVRQGPFPLANAPRDRREWKTDGGRAKFVPAPIPRSVVRPGE